MKLYMKSFSPKKGHKMTVLESSGYMELSDQKELQDMIATKTQLSIFLPILGVIDGGKDQNITSTSDGDDTA